MNIQSSEVDDSFETEFETMDADECFGPVLFTEDKAINILIIGETGVGKSTFINAFANYLTFENLTEVERENPLVLIPCKFTVTDENYELREVKIGSDKNENDKLGQSSTQEPKNYTFPISNGEKFVRLIDTPGIGDTRGIDQDSLNCQKIIDFIAPLKCIHGIMFLMKPNSSKITVLFEFCMKQILSRLEKSASNNLLFVFTNTRGTCYRPGETLPCLRTVLEGISQRPPFVKIPLSKSNIFCLDNEAFRYLAAIANGCLFTERERQYFAESWDKSAEESFRMIFHIVGDDMNKPLEPHQVANTMCVNEARAIINQLKQPMADITQLIQDKLRALQKHKEFLDINNLSLKDMRNNLFVPIIDIEVIELPRPVTVCTAAKCAQIYKVRDVTKYHYVQRCHNPCALPNVPREIIGAAELIRCTAMNGTEKCQVCECSYSTHMHIYYESKTVDKTIEDENIKKNITSKEELKKQKEKIINDINLLKEELEEEHKVIIHYIAKFANFLQQNAITPYNDVYRQYIEYLIDRERSSGEDSDQNVIAYLIKCQKEYDEAKKVFDKAVDMKNDEKSLTPDDVKKSVNDLFCLKHTGKKIKELYTSQISSRKSEEIYNSMNTPVFDHKNKKEGKSLLTLFSNKLKNYLGSKNVTSDVDSDEGNNSNYKTHEDLRKGKGWNKWYTKGKKERKNKKGAKNNGYEEHLKKMEEDAKNVLGALNIKQ